MLNEGPLMRKVLEAARKQVRGGHAVVPVVLGLRCGCAGVRHDRCPGLRGRAVV